MEHVDALILESRKLQQELDKAKAGAGAYQTHKSVQEKIARMEAEEQVLSWKKHRAATADVERRVDALTLENRKLQQELEKANAEKSQLQHIVQGMQVTPDVERVDVLMLESTKKLQQELDKV